MTPAGAFLGVLVALTTCGLLSAVAQRLRPTARQVDHRPPGLPTGPRRIPLRGWRWTATSARQDSADDSVASWCEHSAARLRGGQSLAVAIADAVADVPEVAAGFAPLTHALSRGRSVADAVALLDGDPGRPIGVVRAVLASCAELGGPAAAALDRAAVTLRARAAERAERMASSAQARLSARVLTLLPLGTLGLLAIAEPSVRNAVTTPAGSLCLLAGTACNVAGWWWMRRIVLGASSP